MWSKTVVFDTCNSPFQACSNLVILEITACFDQSHLHTLADLQLIKFVIFFLKNTSRH